MIDFLIKSTLCLGVFLALYHLVLEREKMHHFNRFYLLLSVVISLAIPFITFEITKIIPIAQEMTPVAIQIPASTQLLTQPETVIPVTENTNYWPYPVWILYGLTTIVLLFRFGKNIRKIHSKSKSNPVVKYKNANLILVDEKTLPHTFLNSIFINCDDYNNRNVEDELYTHELVHVTQKHTLDVLFIELLKTIFWFNPLFILYKKSIQLNHEFLADEKVVAYYNNVPFYQNLLLLKGNGNQTISLASNLNYLVTKKRLIMMTKNTSKRTAFLKKLTIVPVLAGLVFFICFKIVAQEKPTITKSDQKVSTKTPQDKIRDSYYANVRILIKDYIKGEQIDKMYEELTLEEKRHYLSWVPDIIIEKEVPEPLFKKLTTTNNAVWINGKTSSKEEIKKHKRTDFVYYTYSFVQKNARTKQFPQEYQYTLYTQEYFDKNLKDKHLKFGNDTLKMGVSSWNKSKNKKIMKAFKTDTIVWFTHEKEGYEMYINDTVKKKKADPPKKASDKAIKAEPTGKGSAETYPKINYLKINGETCFYFTNKKNEVEYYNRWGFRINKQGEIMSQYIDERNNGTKKTVRGQELTIKNTQHTNGVLIEQGYINKDNGTIFFIKKGEEVSYFSRFGEPCDKNGIAIR